MDRTLRDLAAWLMIAHKNFIDATGARMGNFIHNPNSGIRIYNIYEWTVKA